jgi:hypothetical protein
VRLALLIVALVYLASWLIIAGYLLWQRFVDYARGWRARGEPGAATPRSDKQQVPGQPPTPTPDCTDPRRVDRFFREQLARRERCYTSHVEGGTDSAIAVNLLGNVVDVEDA